MRSERIRAQLDSPEAKRGNVPALLRILCETQLALVELREAASLAPFAAFIEASEAAGGLVKDDMVIASIGETVLTGKDILAAATFHKRLP